MHSTWAFMNNLSTFCPIFTSLVVEKIVSPELVFYSVVNQFFYLDSGDFLGEI